MLVHAPDTNHATNCCSWSRRSCAPPRHRLWICSHSIGRWAREAESCLGTHLLLLPCKILEFADSILAAAANEDSDAITAAMHAAFHHMDHHLRTECLYTKDCEGGGSTMTVSVKYPHPTNHLAVGSITSNVGDSPLVRLSFSVDGVNVDNGESCSEVGNTVATVQVPESGCSRCATGCS